MILIFGALLAVYVFCRAILPLKLKWGWKLLLAALLAVAAFKFHLLHLLGGPMFFSPVLPGNVLLAAAWLFSVLFLFFFLLVLGFMSFYCVSSFPIISDLAKSLVGIIQTQVFP